MKRFLAPAILAPLTYSDGRAVMRGDVALLYHVAPLPFLGRRGEVRTIPAFDPADVSDAQLVNIRCRGVTDLASIPFPFRNLLPPNGGYLEAALAHDDGYVSRGWNGDYTRAEVDALLLDLMAASGVPWWKRQLVYWAVRVGGWRGWGT